SWRRPGAFFIAARRSAAPMRITPLLRRARTTSSTRSSSPAAELSGRAGEKVDKVLFPEHCPGMGAVAVGFGALWNLAEAGVGHARHGALGIVEIARIDEIVGGIDPHRRRGDAFQVGPWIVVPRSVELVDHVVGVATGHVARDAGAHFSDGGVARR